MMAEEGEQDMREAFRVFDEDGDSFISTMELCLGLGADHDEIGCTVAAYISPDRAGLAFDDFEVLHRSLGDAFSGTAAPDDEGPTAPLERFPMEHRFLRQRLDHPHYRRSPPFFGTRPPERQNVVKTLVRV
ncbi:hypothetical protein COCNU_05G001450 [Cocos nucifera]|uniref:EF-hand domain-containing protein n=1 Tax=Cocos nucifera TaxID=13894 RepID=A0A8K0I8L0_COCNU|nr:hypothetical protein COCNU_05G001450 [Cocos nucifera]